MAPDHCGGRSRTGIGSVKPLQVEFPLRHLPVPRLLHTSHAVDLLHQSARTPGPAEHPSHPIRLVTLTRTHLRQLERADGRWLPTAVRADDAVHPGPATR